MSPATATTAYAHPLPAIGEYIPRTRWILRDAKLYNSACHSDGFVTVILCEDDDGEWVTWVHNAKTGGRSHGHYHRNGAYGISGECAARPDFARRGFGGAA